MAISKTVKDKPTFRWRMTKMCEDCPFMEHGAGLHLRKSLRPQRWNEIVLGVTMGEKFDCHQTTDETGNGTNLYCAGALDYQKARGIETPYMRICRGFEGVAETKEELFKRMTKIARTAGTRKKRTGG